MKSSVETLSDTSVKLTVEIPFDELQDSIKEAYRNIATQVNVPGFRRGKVPARIIDQRFGRGAVLEEVVNKQVPEAYEAAIRENDLKPLGQPQVEVTRIDDGDLIEFVAEVEITPDFELPSYEGLAVEVGSSEVTDEDVSEQLDELRKQFATVTPVERAAQAGDLVLVDVSGTVDGDEAEEYTGVGLTFEVGADNLVEGFNEAVTGKSADETVTFTFQPEEGPHVDQTVELTVVVKGVRERTLPELDDEFAVLASQFDAIEELREDTRKSLQRTRIAELGYEARDKVLEQLLQSVDFPVPPRFLDAQVEEHFADGHGDEDHRQEVREESVTSLRTQVLLDRIADAEDLSVEQGELIQWLVQQAPRYGMSADQFANALAEAGQVSSAVADVRRGKALALVLRQAKITDEQGNEVDLSVLDEADVAGTEDPADADDEAVDAGDADSESGEDEPGN